MVTPNGGEKDKTAPQLDEKRCFPANHSIHFSGNKIELIFDEFIKLNNPQKNIVISPAINPAPKYLVNGKKLTIQLPDQLQQNTTYSINFGSAVNDITEGNATSDLRYVFSTGSFVDSFSVEGIVRNALTGAPEKGIYVFLNSNLSDTAATKVKPDYFALTDENGHYNIDYVRAGDFQLYAIKDENSNYLLNRPVEACGFADKLISLSAENPKMRSDMRLFQEEEFRQLLKKRTSSLPAKIEYAFNLAWDESARKLITGSLSSDVLSSVWLSDDTLVVWYSPGYEGKVIFSYNKIGDTTYFIYKKKDVDLFQQSPAKIHWSVKGVAELYDKIRFSTEHPLTAFYPEKIKCYKDSVEVLLTWKAENELSKIASHDFLKEANSNFILIAEPGAIKNIYGQSNAADTIRFKVRKADYYGNLLLTVQSVFPDLLIQLVDEKNNLVQQSSARNEQLVTFAFLSPGKYKLRVVLDENHNNKWDTGNFAKRIQPEKIIFYNEVIQIRSNWDVELIWKISE